MTGQELLEKVSRYDKALNDGAVPEIHEKKMLQEITELVVVENIKSVHDLALLLMESKHYLFIVVKYSNYFKELCAQTKG